MVDFLKIAFFVWAGLIFASQIAVISVGAYYKRTGNIPESLYLGSCVLSAIPFAFCFITQVRGIPWSFGWGICFPLVWIHSIGVFAVACFPVTIFEDAEYSGYRLHYRAICLALALLTLSLTLLGTVVHCGSKAVRLGWLQRPARSTTNIQLQVFYHPSATPSRDRNQFDLLPPNALRFVSQSSFPVDEEARGAHAAYSPPPTHPKTGARPNRNWRNLTIRTDIATPRVAHLILSPLKTRPLEIGSLGGKRDTEMKSFGGLTKGEADRRFVAESSPKKHVRMGRGRNVA